jgi:hypothetical protein
VFFGLLWFALRFAELERVALLRFAELDEPFADERVRVDELLLRELDAPRFREAFLDLFVVA